MTIHPADSAAKQNKKVNNDKPNVLFSLFLFQFISWLPLYSLLLFTPVYFSSNTTIIINNNIDILGKTHKHTSAVVVVSKVK